MKSLLSTILLFPIAGFCTTYAPQSVKTYFDNAEVVARIVVTGSVYFSGVFEGEEIGCGLRINAKVIDSLNGPNDDVEFYIDGMRLNVSEEYLVFLESHDTAFETPITSTNSMMQNAEYRRFKACEGEYSGFKADWLNVSSFVHRWSSDKQDFEPWAVLAYNVVIPEGANIKCQSVEIRSILIDGEIVEVDGYWDPGDGYVLPWDFRFYNGAMEWESYKNYIEQSVMKENKSLNRTRDRGLPCRRKSAPSSSAD